MLPKSFEMKPNSNDFLGTKNRKSTILLLRRCLSTKLLFLDTSVNHEVPVSQISLPAWHPSHPSTEQFLPKSGLQLVRPMFQPQLDIINKSAAEEEELNVTKSSFGETGVAKIEEVSNSDEDSGNSSANSSANEDAKKNLQFQVVFQS